MFYILELIPPQIKEKKSLQDFQSATKLGTYAKRLLLESVLFDVREIGFFNYILSVKVSHFSCFNSLMLGAH